MKETTKDLRKKLLLQVRKMGKNPAAYASWPGTRRPISKAGLRGRLFPTLSPLTVMGTMITSTISAKT